MDVDHSLVDAHLEAIPGLGTLTAGGLTGGDSENLSGNADGALGLVALVLGSGNNLSASVLKRLGVTAAEGHSDSLDLFMDLFSFCLFLIEICHCLCRDKFFL